MATPNIIIYAFPGSQFVFKVLAAIQSRNVPHYVHFVSVTNESERRKALPSGGLLVPELQVGLSKTDRVVVSDSEKILHWFDDNLQTNFFPNEKASELSVRATDKTLAAMVWYYNWVDQTGYERSVLRTFAKNFLPWYIFAFRTTVVNYSIAKGRPNFRKQAAKVLELSESDLDNEPMMRSKLIDELKYYQSFLVSDEQKYLLADYEQATAADFSVYAQVERLVGNGGDVEVFASVPELLDDPELRRLWKWYNNMKTTYLVQFKNKSLPKDIEKALFG